VKSEPTRRSVLRGGLASLASASAMFALAENAVRATVTAGPVVETTYGKVRGTSVGGARLFQGIRYGASTAGANRFMPPRPATPWAGVRDATHFGHSAPQLAGPINAINRWATLSEPMSEDCLFVNVFTPGLHGSARRPVMVWLHGGLWENGAGSSPGFDGTNLARNGDVVVVTINHRIDVFGYFHIDDKDQRFADAQNAGVLDMVAALRWVRDNAAAFGGDPQNVTIFGQSGGAAKVTALLAMPAAHGLFHKAIAESCSGGLRLDTVDGATEKAHTLVTRLGLSNPSGSQLQAIPMNDLLAAFYSMRPPGPPHPEFGPEKYPQFAAFKPVRDPQFRPVLDGRSFHSHPFDPAAPSVSANVPLMMGNAATELTLFLADDAANFSLDATEVQRRLKTFWQIDDAATQQVIDTYHAVMPDATPSDLMIAITTDYVYRRNTMQVEDLKAEQHAPVYAYVFDWKTPVMDGVLRSPHTIEIPFVFGTTDAAAGIVGTGLDLAKMTRTVQSAWVHFARTGNPNNPALPSWPRYTTAERATMMLDLESHVVNNPGGEARRALNAFPYYDFGLPRTFIRA
jgi:para-nitrobenzyl esterase